MFVTRKAGGAKPSSQYMYLTSSEEPASSTAILTGWTANSSYPATDIVSNALVVDNSGTVNITSAADVSMNTFVGTVTFYIYHNGSSIKSASTSSTGSVSLSTTGVSVSAGDTIAMYCNGGTYYDGVTIASGSSTTYVEFVSQ